MRRSKFISADMINKLNSNQEESKDDKRRLSKGTAQMPPANAAMPRHSILMT